MVIIETYGSSPFHVVTEMGSWSILPNFLGRGVLEVGKQSICGAGLVFELCVYFYVNLPWLTTPFLLFRTVLDADVMLSSDRIVLDRFVVEMNGRLRLDKLAR